MGNTPTIVTSCLAIALTIVYFLVADQGKFTFIILAAAAWFLVIICWLADKSEKYMHKLEGHDQSHDEKKKLATSYGQQHTVQISSSELSSAKAELSADLDELQSSLKNKDTEIENLKAEIASLHTLVEIEKLRTDLANLKALAAKESAKKK
ncbi:MAG: hypothetical protein WCC52_08850 [Nitrosotalea sp.]